MARDSYNGIDHDRRFVGAYQGVSSGTRKRWRPSARARPASPVSAPPTRLFSGPVNNFLSGTNGAIQLRVWICCQCSSVQFMPNNDLDFDGAAVLHLTNGSLIPPARIFFSSQGPNDIEVNCAVQRDRRADPGTNGIIAILGVEPAGIGLRRQPSTWPRPRYRHCSGT